MTPVAPSSVAPGATALSARGNGRPVPPSGGVLEDLRDTLRVLVQPGKTFRRRQQRRTFVVAWAVASVAAIVLAWFTLSVTQRASAHLLDGVEDAELVASVNHQLRAMRWVALGAAPLHLIAQWTVIAGMFWALGTFLSPGLGYRGALSVAAYAGLPALLGAGLDLGVTWFEGPEFTPDLVPRMISASSVAALIPDLAGPPWLIAAAGQVTVFGIWTAVLWGIGLHHVAGTTRARAGGMALGVALAALAAGTAAELVRSSLMGSAFLP